MFRRDGMTFLVASGAAVLLILLPLACARLSSPPSSKTGTSTSDHDPHFDFYVKKPRAAAVWAKPTGYTQFVNRY